MYSRSHPRNIDRSDRTGQVVIGSRSDVDQPPDDIAGDTLRAAMDQAAESIVIADAIGRIVYANRSAERQVGLPGSELFGRHFVVALAARVDPVRFDDISRTVGTGETWSGRQVATAANGMPVAVDLVVSPIRDAAGRIANVVAIGRDVSRESSLEGDLAREVRLHAGIVSTVSRLDSSDSVEEKAEHLADSLMDLDGVSLARVVSVGPGDVWYRVAARGHDSIVLSGSRPSAALMTSIERRGRTGPWVETAHRWASRTRVRSLDADGISMLAFAPIRHRGSVVGHFSKAFGTTLIAEGIETSAERLALEQLGVTAGQGYLFGRPEAAGGAADRRPPDLPDGPDASPRTGT